MPQQIGAALKDESFYTQAVASGAAVVSFNSLPIAKPEGVSFAYAMLAGRTPSEIPDAAEQVFVRHNRDDRQVDPDVSPWCPPRQPFA